MAKKSGLAHEFYVSGYDLSGDVAAINNCSSPRGVLETPVINKSGMERLLGKSDGLLDFHSWFDDGTELAHSILSTLPRTDALMLWSLGGSVGDPAAFLSAKQIDYPMTRGDDGSFAALSVQGMASIGVPLEWGTMLTAGNDTHSSATSGSTRDDAASSSAGAAAVLHIVSIQSGTPTVVLQDSANDSDWATLISFSAVANGAEPASERKTVSGTVNRYLRLTTTGTFVNLVFAVAIRRGETVDDEAYA